MTYTITDIEYDTEGYPADLPKTLEITVDDDLDSDERLEFISDEISNITGFCHFGFSVSPEIN